jgi:C-terminal processing protease CtpA/Prc
MRRLPVLLLGFVLACGSAAKPVDAPPAEPRELTNLRAFARLYGVLRFFHPSDEAAALDWNRYAVLGVERVRGARDAGELETALEALVLPIAPTVQILGAGEPAADPPAPASTDGLDLVAWQHKGPGLEGGAGPYVSKRTSRPATIAADGGAGWTAVSQAIDATGHRGKPFRLRARVKVGANVQAGAWARVDREGGAPGFFDNMGDRMIDAAAWTEAVIEGTIDRDAAQLAFGGLVMGAGEAWFDDFELTIGGAAITLANPGFADGTDGWGGGIAKGNGRGEAGYTFTADGGALHVAPAGGTVLRIDLFVEQPAAGEIVEVDLGGGLRARVPIALWSKDGHTLPAADPAPITAALAAVGTGLDDADARIADLIVTWSVLDQFYPYFDVAAADWPGALDRALVDGLDDAVAADHAKTLGRLVAAVEDGHGNALVAAGPEEALPLRLGWVEDRLVVLGSAVPELARGDVIEAIDGVPAAEALDAEIALRSGSPQWRREIALTLVGRGAPGSSAALRVARAGGAAAEVTVARGQPPAEEFAHPPLVKLDGGVWYVDLERSNQADIAAKTAEIAKAPGVVFDLRGYPNGTHAVLQHLMTAPEQDRWMHVARIIRPALPGAPRPEPLWDSMGWDLTPAEPRITGTAVFLTGGGAISYAESVMGYVEALGLPIVGAPTAGTNGNIRRVALPTGSSVIFTGMKVTRHDGTRSHLEGIRPTIPVEPTLAGIRAGHDEVLDRALELIRETASAPR